jgi:predicted PurR-regulated permease PerM
MARTAAIANRSSFQRIFEAALGQLPRVHLHSAADAAADASSPIAADVARDAAAVNRAIDDTNRHETGAGASRPVRTTAADGQRLDRVTAYGIAALFVYLVYQLFQPFLVALTWAVALAICFDPMHQRLARRTGRSAAAALATVLVALAIIIPMLGAAAAFVTQAAELVSKVPHGPSQTPAFAQQSVQTMLRLVPGGDAINSGDVLADSAKRAAAFLSDQAAAILHDTLRLVLDVAITLFALFFFFRDGPALMAGVRRAIPLDQHVRERLIRQTGAIVRSSVTSSIVVALAQGILCGVAFWTVGFRAPLFWGVVTMLACVLPFGAWVVWAPAAVWLAVTGQVGHGLLLAALGTGIVSVADNVLRPLLMSEQAEMNGLLLLVSLLGGAAAFGSVGLVAGPVLMAAAIALFDVFTSETATH